jgi:hypothetical protein
MTRLAAVVGISFAAGVGVMSALGGIIGGLAEAAALGVVGLGLVGSSYLMTPRAQQRQASTPAQRAAS